MKLSTYILLGFLFILILFSATTFINYRLSEAVNSNASYLSRSASIVRSSSRFQRNVINMVSGLRGYLLTGERSFIESYEISEKENDSILVDLKTLVTDSTQQKLLSEITVLNSKWTDEYTEPLARAKAVADASDSSLSTFNKIYRDRYLTGNEKGIQDELQQKIREFTNLEYRIRDIRKVKLTKSVQQTRIVSFSLTLVSLIAGIGVIILLVRKISRRISQMTGMADAIAQGNYSVHISDPGKDELSSLGHSLNHMADELYKNITLLKRSNAELDQFAHIVSHDMKSPLRGIGNVVSWIEEDHEEELSPQVDEYLQIIKRRIARAEDLIAGLLSYARIGKDEVAIERVNVRNLIEEILEETAHERIQVQVDPLPELYTERLLLYQVFSNLISNSIKYNDKEQAMIHIYHKEHTDQHEFFVEDNGPGIAESYHSRIFTIFQTLNDRDTFESTGVGLAIVKKILDSKKLQITLVSSPAAGAVFSFTWPK